MGYRGEGSARIPPSLLAKRERFHLAYRLAGRSYQLLISERGRIPQRRMAHAGVWAVGDILGAVVLRRSSRFALGPRLVVDAADTALWSQGTVGLELATMTGVPLAIEAGLRMGAVGLLVPMINAAVTGSVRRLRGRPVSSGSFRYQAMAVALGAGIAAYERNRRLVALARHQQDLEARIGAAHVAGQNEVATGADTVVDLLSRTGPLLSSAAGTASVGRMLADWRQSLAASTSEQANYLGTSLARWQRRHNESQPDLSADITFEIAEGHGTILLSGEQAVWLEGTLERLALRGRVTVAAVDIVEARQPNQPCRLLVAQHAIDIPADSRPGLVPFDVGPLGFLASSMWFADTLLPGECEPRAWAVVPGAAAGPILAIWAHRQVARRGETAHAPVLFTALAHSLVHGVGATGTMRNIRNVEGIQRFPFLGGINMIAMMVPLYWGDLDAFQRSMVVAGIIMVVGVGLAVFPQPIQWGHLIAELLWPAAAFYSMSTMRTQLESETERMNADLEEADQAALTKGFADGRSHVLELASATRYAARREFASVRDRLEESTRTEVERRLNEVDKRLEELSCANVS